jgi:hypothetical protein
MRRSRMPIAIVLLASTAVVFDARTATPPVLIPGSSDVTTGHIKPGSAGYRYLMRASTGDTTERELGTGHTEQVLTEYKGKPAVLLVASVARTGQTFLDSALVMRAGLVPVWETSYVGSRVTHYEYAGKQVRLTITSPDSGTRSREHTYDVPVFHFNELDMLIRSLPLRAAYEAILPLYSEGSDELEMDTVRVMARDADGIWSVRFADPAIVSTYGIHPSTRAIVRYDVLSRRSGGVGRKVPIQ